MKKERLRRIIKEKFGLDLSTYEIVDNELKTRNYIYSLTGLGIEDVERYEIYLPNFKNPYYDNSEVNVNLSLFSAKRYEEMEANEESTK